MAVFIPGGFMPEFEGCVSYEGTVYCWNSATNKMAVIDVRDLDLKDCPECVVQAVVRNILMDKKERAHGAER
jgi:hypothetical protein